MAASSSNYLFISTRFFLKILYYYSYEQKTEAATRGALCKKMFLEISQNSQKSSCAESAQVFVCKFCEIFKNTFSHRIHLVEASEKNRFWK